ncbi:MAG TPA: hypothetical protein VFN10_14730 [Thermoanaerobaculia bacterium]|nr:hypothetical protein [Thermoanaerobaculia bacterium]
MTDVRRAIPLLAAALGLTLLFLFRFQPAALLLGETLPPLFAASAALLACFAAGKLALLALKRDADPLTSLLIGYTTFGTLVGLVAWTGLAIHELIPIVTIAFASLGAVMLLRARWSGGARPADFFALLIPIAIAFIAAITPVSSPDEMIYKLAVPHAYLEYGRMLELPLNSNSYLALATHGTDLAALALHGGTAAKLARFGLFLATLLVLLRFARRIAGEQAWWPVAAITFTPALAIVAGWCWDEWAVIGLAMLALDAFEADDHTIAFAAAGGAIASKYTALPWLFAFAIVAAFRIRNARALAKAALLVAAFGGFFYVRNLIWTGSPVAPLLERDAPAVMNYKTGESFSGWRELARGSDIFDKNIVDESLGIMMPLSALAALFAIRRRDRVMRDLLLIGLIQLPILISIAPGSRNIVMGVVPLALAGSAMCVEIWRNASRALRFALSAVAAIALIAQLALIGFVFESYEYARYLAGRETASAYLARLQPFTKLYSHIAATTPPTARLLLLGETRVFHLDRQAVWGGNLDGPRIANWLAQFPNAAALHDALRAQGITHVVLGSARYRVASGQPLTMLERETILEVPSRTDAIITELLKTRAALRYRDEGYLLFELR